MELLTTLLSFFKGTHPVAQEDVFVEEGPITVICLFFVVKIFLFPVHRTKIIFMKILRHEFLACMQLQVLC